MPYFGGALSVDGTLSMSIGKSADGSISVRPIMRFNSTSSEKLQTFEIFGIEPIKNMHNTYVAKWTGYKAASIASRLLDQGVSPTREEILLGFKNWSETDNIDERVEIAEALQRPNSHEHIPIEHSVWLDLLRNKKSNQTECSIGICSCELGRCKASAISTLSSILSVSLQFLNPKSISSLVGETP